jgi:predicted TPR repeat methyltransferase
VAASPEYRRTIEPTPENFDAMNTETQEPAKEATLEDALRMAVQMQQNRQLEGAEQLYRRILALVPDHPDALHLLGMVHHQTGRSDEGVALIEQAIRLQPDFAGFHINLGNIHASRLRIEEATRAYERASVLAPDSADLHNNLGALYRAQNRHAEGKAEYLKAIELDPRHLNAHNNMGLLLSDEGDIKGAIRYYCRSVELMPGHPDGRKLLGMAYYTMGKIDEAAEVFRQWLGDEPDHPMAQHMYAACSGKNVPDRAPDNYVEYTFDRFADSFETQLNERLQYQAPQLCAAMLARHLPPPAKQFVILDAGCGTGLCGPLVAPWARSLGGVDLSRGMLDHAQAKAVYTDLYKAELTEFLRESPNQWEVVLSADTLCYFGDLQALMQAAGTSIRAGGTLVFTVEVLEEDKGLPFCIQPNGRYAHARSHVERVLQDNGLELLEITRETLRQEGGEPVSGWLVAAHKRVGG